MSNTEENLAAVERELAADVAMAEGRADAEDATLPEPAAGFIYLDYAATAPLCAEAAGAMAPFQVPGPANLAVNANANALYGVGRAAFDLLESARRRAARALGARRPDEIVFTSGATEADDAAVLGLVQAAAEQRRLAGQKDRPLHVVTSAIEHDAVLECAITGVPDPVRGQLVKATVVLAPGYSPSEELKKELQQYVKKETAPYKYPLIVEFVSELPKTISGKIRRVAIREAGEKKE